MRAILPSSLLGLLLAMVVCAAQAQDLKPVPLQGRLISSIELSQAFDARPGWRLTAFQGPDSPELDTTGPVPGKIRLCVSRDGGTTCSPDLDQVLRLPSGDDDYSVARYLMGARIVHVRDKQPLLFIQISSEHSLDNDQRIGTVVLAYDKREDHFTSVYEKRTGQNNSQEVRYIADGLLTGAIISAEPTTNAPFGFWVTVNRLSPDGGYKQVLRYRSATRYGDGNPLAVIDSEMPEILHRLGLLHPGDKLPLPPGECARPHLTGQELWC